MNDSSALAGVLVIVATIGQVLFVVLWVTRDGWWREWVGRALMVKSAAFGLYLCAAVASMLVPFAQGVWLALFALIVVGIIAQDVALLREIHRAKRDHRAVGGTGGEQ